MFHALLVESGRFGAVYADGMSNHFPMALLALHRLGASDDRLREFASFYQRRLRAKPADEAARSREYEDDLHARGREAFLRDNVGKLTPGIASEAFHGVIRTAYAVDSGDDTDLPDALTSWVIGYQELGRGSGEPRFERAGDAFAAMHRDDRFAVQFTARGITGRIAKVAALPAFDDYRSSIKHLELGDLAKIAVDIYLATADFTALHLVTACHATRVLQPYLAGSALEHLATAMLAGYATIGRPAFDVSPPDAPPWEEIAARAIASNDDHDLKLVYCCREEERAYGWGLHRAAAAQRLECGGPSRRFGTRT